MHLLLKCYIFQILQPLKLNDCVKHATFCAAVMEKISVEDDFLSNIIFSNEAMFHLSGTLSHHSVCVYGAWKPLCNNRAQQGQYTGECVLSLIHEQGVWVVPFVEQPITSTAYFDMMELWLMPQLEDCGNTAITLYITII
jgi:hypothetical protein